MATIKSFTSLEQAKKLAEILPLESADMEYILEQWIDEKTGRHKEGYCEIPVVKVDDDCPLQPITHPCWNLSALLSVLPRSITKYIESERCQKTFHLNLFRSYYHCCSYSFSPSISDNDGDNTLYCVGRDNWVDACVAMIEKLNELNLL